MTPSPGAETEPPAENERRTAPAAPGSAGDSEPGGIRATGTTRQSGGRDVAGEVSNRVEGSTVGGSVFQVGGVGGDLTVHQVHHHAAPAPEVRWPVLLGPVPNLAGHFQNRPETAMLHAALADGGARTAVLGQVVTGTGGVGKTQLAAHHAHQTWQVSLTASEAGTASKASVAGAAGGGPAAEAAAAGPGPVGPGGPSPAGPPRGVSPAGAVGGVGAGSAAEALPVTVDLVVWVNATTAGAVTAAYAQAAREVVPGRYDGQDAEEAALGFLGWLRGSGRRWLIVLDNVPDPAALTGLWPPEVPAGRTVVTTRSRHAAWTTSTRTLLQVAVYTPVQSLAYLRSALDHPDRAHLHDSDEHLAALAADLGHLPIALAQAAAYLTDTARTIDRYRTLLADRTRALRQSLPDQTGLPDQQHLAVAALWDISIEQADRTRPEGLARPLLELIAVLDPDQIPDTVLTTKATRTHLTHTTRPNAPGSGPGGEARPSASGTSTAPSGEHAAEETGPEPVDVADAEDALRVLDRLNLLDHTPAPPGAGREERPSSDQGSDGRGGGRWGTVHVHRLVQHAVRDTPTARAQRGPLVRAAADALLEAWPAADHHDRALAAALRTNTTVLTTHADDHLWHPDRHDLLDRAGTSLLDAGLHQAATTHWRHLTTTAERHLGHDHPDTLTTRANLAHSYYAAGRTAEAIAIEEQVLTDRERILGHDHPDTLGARNNLAVSYHQAGRTAEAIAIEEQVLTDAERLLGAEHPHTLSARTNLAASYRQAGRTAEAIAIEEQVAADRERLLGHDHPDTLTARSNLATSYRQAERTAEATGIGEQVVADFERVLGHDHPNTLTARANLATSYYEAGHTEKAIAIEEQVLTDRERILGHDHPDTLGARNNLAVSYHQAGRTAEAIAIEEQVLTDAERLLGAEHPHTLSARTNLAASYRQAGRTAEAIAIEEQVAADRERLLGHDHPDTLTARSNLATAYRRAGRIAEAIALLERVIADRERILGHDHPDTLGAHVHLAFSYYEAGAHRGGHRPAEAGDHRPRTNPR
ncbi:tetratricopeptide repeat protein [Kitasatospora sp. NPDC058032]|uniref:tetratricopeptide repeat protein n=1 Tax=Kitasatospora sp. NPDC058032 TaxID=3346307 RepID=UPI0036DE2077